MNKKTEDRRSQPEFFFVFDSESKTQSVQQLTAGVSERNVLGPNEAKAHRDRLIEELREFGC